MSRFTISLPSNSSMDLNPNNKVSQWKTKLSEFSELQDKWELELLEVSFPGEVYNVYGNCYYFVVGGLRANRNMTAVLGDGTYDTIHSVIGEIQRSYVMATEANNLPEDRFVVQIRYANRQRRVKIIFTEYTNSGNWVYFSDDLARCSASSRNGTTGSGVQTLNTKFMPNDRCF